MPSRSTLSRLDDIRDNILRARRFIEELNFGAFENSELHFFGVTRCLEIISEATRHLPNELKARHRDIPWGDIAGAGNVYRHDYEAVRIDLVWGTVVNRLPELLVVIEQELARLNENDF